MPYRDLMGLSRHTSHNGLVGAIVAALLLPAATLPSPAHAAGTIADLRADIAAVETTATQASARALAAGESASRARAEADAAAQRAADLQAQTSAADAEVALRRARLGTVAAGLYRSTAGGPLLAQLLTSSDPESLLGRLSTLERVADASARTASAARSAAEVASALRAQADEAARERERLARAAEDAAARAQSEADAEAAAVAAAQQALDAVYARLAAARGTSVAREKQAHLTERASADATAPTGAGAGAPAAPGATAPAPVPTPVTPAPATPTMTPAQAQAHARSAIGRNGWGDDQFGCLVSLWNRESGWRFDALNRSSGAYGIPQALPAEKMASAGADWRTNASTQIAWGLSYIKARYGTPCGAWDHSQRTGWY